MNKQKQLTMKKLFISLLLVIVTGGVLMGQATKKEVDLITENAELMVKYAQLKGEFDKLRSTYNDALKTKVAELETDFNEYKMNVVLQYNQKELELHKQYLGASDSTDDDSVWPPVTNETLLIVICIGFFLSIIINLVLLTNKNKDETEKQR